MDAGTGNLTWNPWIEHRKLAPFEFHHNLPTVGKQKHNQATIMSDGYESVEEDEVDEVDEESEEEVATKKKRREKKWKVKFEAVKASLKRIECKWVFRSDLNTTLSLMDRTPPSPSGPCLPSSYTLRRTAPRSSLTTLMPALEMW